MDGKRGEKSQGVILLNKSKRGEKDGQKIVLVLLNKSKRGRIKWEYISLAAIILLVFFIFGVSSFLSKIKVGEFVYQQDETITKIGQVKGISLAKVGYVVEWQDRTITSESAFSIDKLSNLRDVNVEQILSSGKRNQFFYFGGGKGESIVLSNVSALDGRVSRVLVGVPGMAGNSSVSLQKGCSPNFICNSWSKCEVEYDLYNFLSGVEIASGVQHRYCKDYSGCMTDFLDSRDCETKVPVNVKKNIICGKEYIEVYDSKEKLISRMLQTGSGQNEKLDMNIVLVDSPIAC